MDGDDHDRLADASALDEAIAGGDVLERQFVLGNGCNVDTSDCKREPRVGRRPVHRDMDAPGRGAHLPRRSVVTAPCAVEGEETAIEHTARATITLTVTDAILLGDEWTATEMTYAGATPTLVPTLAGCPTGTQTESGIAVPGTAVPDTAVPALLSPTRLSPTRRLIPRVSSTSGRGGVCRSARAASAGRGR